MLDQRRTVAAAATLAVTVLAACGGGGSSASLPPAPTSVAGSTTPITPATKTATPTPAPATTPTATSTATPAAAPLGTAQLAGAAGFVNALSRTVYVFDGDLSAPGTSTCNGACAGVWPSVPAAANQSYPAPFGAIKRSDGNLQLTYAGRPLYTFVVDTGPGSAAGNGIDSFGNIWHIARPSGVTAAAATPAPGTPGY